MINVPEEWIVETRHRLEIWGEHQRGLPGQRLGAPSSSCIVPKVPGAAVSVAHPVADQMDRVLAMIRLTDPKAFRVLWLIYYQQHSNNDAADIMHLSLGRLRGRKEAAESMVAAVWRTLAEIEDARQKKKKAA